VSRFQCLAAALALATLGASCGSSPENAAPPTTPRTLTPEAMSIWLGPSRMGAARFQLFGPTGAPLPSASVAFSILDNPDTLGQEAQGATLVNVNATTDAMGYADAGIMTGMPTTFVMRATSADALAEVTIIVTAEGRVGAVDVAPFYVSPGGRAALGAISTEIRMYDNNLRCADLPLRAPPRTTVPMLKVSSSGSLAGVAHYKFVATNVGHAILARAMNDKGIVLAIGCTDLPGPALVAGDAVQVSVPMVDVGSDPVGHYLAITPLTIAPPLAAAATLGATWRDLTDCPLDPAQLWLDCTLDALGPTSDADPLDCVPATAPGGDGALGDELSALRGVAVAGPDGMPTACRGSKTAMGTISIDAVTQGLYGSPLPLPLLRLAAAADDAAHLFDTLKLDSTIDLDADPTARTVGVTHTLTNLTFALPAEMTSVALQRLGLPVLSVSTTGTIDDDDVLSIAQHGFTLRLGTAARVAFGTIGLLRRGLPADVRGLVMSIAALAHSEDGALSGCAALDAALCGRVARAPGCLVAACGNGLDALATRLSSSFDAADGTGLDLYLAGKAPLLDNYGNGQAGKLGDLKIAAQEGTWTVDLRPRGGRRTVRALWEASRQTPP
jgi:hypothetical protein